MGNVGDILFRREKGGKERQIETVSHYCTVPRLRLLVLLTKGKIKPNTSAR